MEKTIDFSILGLINKERLMYHYLDTMLLSVEDGETPEEYKKIEKDRNDRISNFDYIIKMFEKEFIRTENGQIEFVSNFDFENKIFQYKTETYSKGVNTEIIQELANDAMICIEDIVKYEKETEGKELKDTSAVILISQLCDVYHKYNDDEYNDMLIRIAALSNTTQELADFNKSVHENKIFNSGLTGKVKYMIENVGNNNENYNLFNSDLKKIFLNDFFEEKSPAHYISIRFLKNNEVSDLLKDICNDERFKDVKFKDVKFKGGSEFINFNGLLNTSISKLLSGKDVKDSFFELNVLKDIGVFENDSQRKMFDTEMFHKMQAFEEGGVIQHNLQDDEKTEKYKGIVLNQLKNILSLKIPENELIKRDVKKPRF